MNELTEDLIYKTGDQKKSPDIKLTLSQIDQHCLKKLSDICSKNKITLHKDDRKELKNYLTVSFDNFDTLLHDIEKSDMKDLSNEIEKAYLQFKDYDKMPVRIGETEFKQQVIMGILNVTPDSFSDGGKYLFKEDAVAHAIQMLNNGVDIIDVGGESTKPGSDPVPEDEELRRVIPVIKEILNNKPNAFISIDTTKRNVAIEACKAGARIINDISGLTFDPKIIEVAKEYSATLVIMHIKGTPKNMQTNPVYDDLIYEIYEFLYNQTQKAKDAGVKNIIIDPGIGFGKKAEDNFEILRRLPDFKSLGYPILIGLSRKSFLGKYLDLEIEERDTMTSVAEALAIRNGAKIIRTHNVANAVRVKQLLNYIYSY